MEAERVRELRRRIGYPDVPVPAARDWSALAPGYAPVEYTAPSVPRPDTDLAAVWRRAVALSCAPRLRRDPATGRPLNPAGPTGIAGHGRLHRLGPNPAADGVVTYGSGPRTLVLLVRRGDTGQPAFPGGFRNPDADGRAPEDALRAACREVAEETGVRVDGAGAVLLHRGVAHWSVRNTDHAWIENTAFHLPLPPRPDGPPEASGRDDAQAARWVPVGSVDAADLSHVHRITLRNLRVRIGI